ncbi:hypothetical protein Tco_1528044, partial [Tanacetum coccineum]
FSNVKGNRVTAVKASAGCVWRPKKTDLNNGSKDNSGSWISKRINYIDPQDRLKHMTGNKALLTDYQDIDGGFVAFGGSTRGGRDTKVPQSGGPSKKFSDEDVHKELGDRMERAATTASSLEAEQDSDAQTRFEAASKSPLIHLSQ